MAGKTSKKGQNVVYQGFANISLTKGRKQAIKELAADGGDYSKWLENLTNGGYKVSFSWSEDAGCYTVTAYQNDPESDHAGWATSGRHNNLETALAALYYAVRVVIAEEGWPDGNGKYEW